MKLDDMLMLGDPGLHLVCDEITQDELPKVHEWAKGLDSIILQVQEKYGFGRAVAAPQMGIFKRLVCMHIDKPVVMINPVLTDKSPEVFLIIIGIVLPFLIMTICYGLIFYKVEKKSQNVFPF